MRSTFHKAGNFNLRGKKSARLRCGCCSVYNLKDKQIKVEHIKEIKQESK